MANIPTQLPQYVGPVVEASTNRFPVAFDPSSPFQAVTEFWPINPIQPLKFNQQFPYCLLVVSPQAVPSGPTVYIPQPQWSFTLPIPPESLSISMPFASAVSATQGGVLEENNGAPFRDISISGTTGVLPLRGSATVLTRPPISIQGGNANTAIKTATAVANATALANIVETAAIATGPIGITSGYYQFHLLRQFLERYAELKQSASGYKYRLALACFKDDQTFLVTPRSFVLNRNASSPYEYPYSLQFRAYKRINLGDNPASAFMYTPPTFDPSSLGSIQTTAQSAQNLLVNAVNTLTSLGLSPVNSILEPLRQTVLYCKATLGTPQTLFDMPASIIQDSKQAVLAWAATQQAWSYIASQNSNPNNTFTKQWDNLVQTAQAVAGYGQQTGAGNTVNPDLNTQTYYNAAPADPANDPFSNPNNYSSLFQSIPLGLLSLPRELNLKIRNERYNVSQMRRIDWENLRDSTLQFLVNYENSIGAGSDVYNATYQGGVNNTSRSPSQDDFQVIYSLNDYITSLSQLASAENTQAFQSSSVNYIAGLAQQSGLAFTVPNSKFLVPFPYSATMETLAIQYLGDPNRWIEIVALNGLQPPYIDETGFDVPLLTDGHDNTILVGNATNLYVGQPIYLISNTQNKSQRIIERINNITTSQYLLTLNGDANLADFTTTDISVLHAWLPGTVNSQQSLYIPSPDTPDYADFIYKAIPNVNYLDSYYQVAGTDLLLNQNNDLIVNPDGSSPIATGLNWIVQDCRIKVLTPQGSLVQHPSFGLPLQVGQALADSSATSALTALQQMFTNDSTYTGLEFCSVDISGPVAQIQLSVGVRGITQNIPISFNLPQLP